MPEKVLQVPPPDIVDSYYELQISRSIAVEEDTDLRLYQSHNGVVYAVHGIISPTAYVLARTYDGEISYQSPNHEAPEFTSVYLSDATRRKQDPAGLVDVRVDEPLTTEDRILPVSASVEADMVEAVAARGKDFSRYEVHGLDDQTFFTDCDSL